MRVGVEVAVERQACGGRCGPGAPRARRPGARWHRGRTCRACRRARTERRSSVALAVRGEAVHAGAERRRRRSPRAPRTPYPPKRVPPSRSSTRLVVAGRAAGRHVGAPDEPSSSTTSTWTVGSLGSRAPRAPVPRGCSVRRLPACRLPAGRRASARPGASARIWMKTLLSAVAGLSTIKRLANDGGSRRVSRAACAASPNSCGVARRRRPSVVAGDISAMLWNGVSRTPRLSMNRCRNASSSTSPPAAASAPLRGRSGRNRYSARQPSRVTCQGRPCSSMTACTPAVNRSASGDHPLERLVGEHLAERGPDGRHRQRVAGQRPADAADVGLGPGVAATIRSATSAVMP